MTAEFYSSPAPATPAVERRQAPGVHPPATPGANLSPAAARATVWMFRVMVDRLDHDHRYSRDHVAQLVAAAERLLELHAAASEQLERAQTDLRCEVAQSVELAAMVREHVQREAVEPDPAGAIVRALGVAP